MTETEINVSDEFASTMQQLVAEAASTLAPAGGVSLPTEAMFEEFSAMHARIGALERAMTAGFEKMSARQPGTESNSWQWERVDENLRALRNTDSVNQRLFNSLHEELRRYRDNFLRDALQKPFIRDLIVLFDDLSVLARQMEGTGATRKGRSGKVVQWSANLENAIHSVMEILHRMEVNQIEPKESVDLACHKVVSFEPTDDPKEDGQIVRRLKPGFVWREQVMRPEEVVAKRFGHA